MNEANGMSHMEGKVAQSSDELLGSAASFKHGLEIRRNDWDCTHPSKSMFSRS
jgi:hypothetical protein